MARKPSSVDNLQQLNVFRKAGAQESLEPAAKVTRSPRGLTADVDTSQICFRIEKERHRALKV